MHWRAALRRRLHHAFAVLYLTPRGSQAVRVHTDDQDVFVLHLVGGKPWEPGDPGAGEYPLSHGVWHAIRRECGLPDDGY